MTPTIPPELYAVFVDPPENRPEAELWCVRQSQASAEDERDNNFMIRDQHPRVERYVSESSILGRVERLLELLEGEEPSQ